ncbi:MAG: glycosyltransferase [Proteobacteria bacterium]|nr:glycosyltransferase [Pseudomonadota bacterium]MBU1688278.1 glycosyltransferase [Pseudomonadota bacterium]
MNRANILIITAISIIFSGFWALLNRPEPEPAWPDRIQGFSFSPMQIGQSPVEGLLPTEEEIDADLTLLTGKTHAIRTYSVEGVLGEIPRLAKRHELNVTLGAWLGSDEEQNKLEIARLLEVAQANYSNVVRVIVGNEAVLRGDLSVEQVTGYLDQVREELAVPVSTAEPWHVWLKHQELATHADYIATHMLPYWEGVTLERAVDYVADHVELLRQTFPDKKVVIAEVGWPSNGRTRHGAVASSANEAIFLRRFLERAHREKYIYYVMEAFDQPWKQVTEGAVGAYWGVYDVERQPKFAFDTPIIRIPEWRLLAAISAVIAFITFALLLTDTKTLRLRGRSFLATIAFGASTAAVWIVYTYTRQYLSLPTVLTGLVMVFGTIGVVVVLLSEAHEWAEATWLTQWRRPFTPRKVPLEDLPMVSVHVPAYNEPPDMMIDTLNALAALQYQRYEVIVIDNNTRDPEIWQPVEKHCLKLGERFHFYHIAPLAGFKAGALNFALTKTSPEAEVVAVIDSDYLVTPDWLLNMTPQFSIPALAIAQAPQDYHDDGESLFKAMCYAEYQGFFYIGMMTRNERNAIIQHGTMTMVRRSVLEEVGGWSEWCITEDAELGLRIFEKGYEATYIPQSYGKGLMPDTFGDYRKQRFRWAYGAVQILRSHAGLLLGWRNSRLTQGQRYHFLAGWLPWLTDSLNLLFTLAALAWSTAMALMPTRLDPPLIILSIMPLILFSFKIGKMLYLYRTRVGTTVAQTMAAALAGLSLSHTISKAILHGLVTRGLPFFRTPKQVRSHAILRALAESREEALIMISLWLAAVVIVLREGPDSADLLVWIVVLLVQSIPYLAAVVMALISGFSHTGQKMITEITVPPPQIQVHLDQSGPIT